MLGQAIPIDPALLAYFPSASSRRSTTVIAPPQAAPSPSAPFTPRIGVGYGGSGGGGIGVGVGVGTGIGVGVGFVPSSTSPAELGCATKSPSHNLSIDPALFELEEVVMSIRAEASSKTLSSGYEKRYRAGGGPPRKKLKSIHPPRIDGEETKAGSAPGTLAEVDMSIDTQIDPTLRGVTEEGTGLGEEFDPTIREIVKSLTQAQENQPQDVDISAMALPSEAETDAALTQALTDAQTVAAISAHLVEVGGEGIEQEMPTSLADMTTDQLNSFFQQTSPAHNYILSEYDAPQTHNDDHHSPHPDPPSQLELHTGSPYLDSQNPVSHSAGPSSIPHAKTTSEFEVDLDNNAGSDSQSGVKRKRGRPKGSKNKPKPYTSPPPLKEPVVRPKPAGPPKKIGRPPKERTGAELEEHLRRQAELAAGIKRQRGRPRKFPGYLVRDMRLKANREEFREVVKRAEEVDEGGVEEAAQNSGNRVQDEAGTWETGGGGGRYEEGDGMLDEGEEEYDWATDPQNLMDAVTGQMSAGDTGMGLGMEGMDDIRGEDAQQEDEPSANTGLGREDMGEMFGLEGEVVDGQS